MALPIRASRLHGGLLGAVIGVAALAVVLVSSRVLHAPLLQPASSSLAIRGPKGFVTGWHVDQGLAWNVMSERSAHHCLIVRIETPTPGRARDIAARLVPLVGASYGEVLIYVYRPGRGQRVAERRIQWTPAGGFDELVMTP